jgi:hypothetical protein
LQPPFSTMTLHGVNLHRRPLLSLGGVDASGMGFCASQRGAVAGSFTLFIIRHRECYAGANKWLTPAWGADQRPADNDYSGKSPAI